MSKKILSVVSLVLTFCLLMTMGVSAAAKADYYALDDYISKFVPATSNTTNGVYDEAELDSLSDLLYSFDHSLPSTSQSVVDGYLASLKTAVGNLTVDESKANAKFEITTDKTNVSTGDIVKVSVKLQTNYPIFSMQIPVLYDAEVFEVQNTSSVASSFLTFSGQMATGYVTNGNWNVASSMYKRNSNPSYWSSAEMMSKYKIALASWSVDSTRNIYPVTLNESEEIISFELKVISNEKDISGSIFLNSDWLKTATARAGILTAGRAVGEVFGTASGAYKDVGQTVDLSDAVCDVAINTQSHQHTPDDGTVTTPATCTEDGVKTYACTECGETLSTEVITATGHTGGVAEVEVLDGKTYTVVRCISCNEILSQTEVLADYTAVETAIAESEKIDSIYYVNYDKVTEAIAAVEYDLNASEQATVDAYAKSINDAVAGLVKVVDDLGLYYSSVTQDGNTIRVESNPNATQVGIKTETTSAKKAVVIEKSGTPITQLSASSNYRYQLKSSNVSFVQVGANRAEAVVNTTMTIGDVSYNLQIVMVQITFTKSDLKAMCVVDTQVDKDAKTIELTSKEGAAYVVLYTENNGFKFDVDMSGHGDIDKPTTYRYYFYKTSESATTHIVTTVAINGEVYTLTVNIVAAPFTPTKYITPINGTTFLGKYGEETATIIQMKPEKSYVGVRTAGLGGSTLEIDYEGVPGLTLTKNSSGVPYIKAKPLTADMEDIVTTVKIILSNGTVYEMPLIFRFKDVTVSALIVSTDYIETSRSVYDKDNGTMEMYASTDSIARIRKTALNGLVITINADEYAYVTDAGSYYEISCPFMKTATFTMSFNDEDSTQIAVTVSFVGAGENYNTAKLVVSNGSVKFADEFTFKIQSNKSSMKVNETLSTGESFAIAAEEYSFITYTNGVYSINQSGLGEKFNFTVDGATFTGVVEK